MFTGTLSPIAQGLPKVIDVALSDETGDPLALSLLQSLVFTLATRETRALVVTGAPIVAGLVSFQISAAQTAQLPLGPNAFALEWATPDRSEAARLANLSINVEER